MAMSDKRAFVDAVRNKYAPSLPPIDADRYGPMKGLEGPFRLRSGKVVYYDPKEGKYYDRDRDMYMSHDEYDSHANPRESVDFFRFAEILNEEMKRRSVPMRKPLKIASYKKMRWNITPKSAEKDALVQKRMRSKLARRGTPAPAEQQPKKKCPKCGSALEIDYQANTAMSDPHGFMGPVYVCSKCGAKGHLLPSY